MNILSFQTTVHSISDNVRYPGSLGHQGQDPSEWAVITPSYTPLIDLTESLEDLTDSKKASPT